MHTQYSILNTKGLRQTSFVLLSCLMLTGCPIEGDDGKSGVAGVAGVDGIDGKDGVNGINCWDLNEDGEKSMPSEDSNQDGAINVLDCRVAVAPASTTLIVDPATETVKNQHARQSFTTFTASSRILLFTGTYADYDIATDSGNYASLDSFLTEPVEDPCGIWKWVEENGQSRLQATDAIGYDTEHYPAIALDGDGNTHEGREACRLSCLSDANCVAAGYQLESSPDSNTIMCTKAYKPGFDVGDNSEFVAARTYNPGWLAANLSTVGNLITGVISVCDIP